MTDHIHRRIGAALTLIFYLTCCAFTAASCTLALKDYAVAQAREAGR
jgi:hypothetical protein